MVFNRLDVIPDAEKLSHFSFEECSETFKTCTKKSYFKVVSRITEHYGRFIRKEDFDNEVKILSQILQSKNSQLPLIQNKKPLNFTGLTQGKQKAAEIDLTLKDKTIMIQGYASVGKITQFKMVAKALKITVRMSISSAWHRPIKRSKN
ncbi:MAG: hypothetical protein ACL7BU_06340 [Candidatus Phlomobacter fragariae]